MKDNTYSNNSTVLTDVQARNARRLLRQLNENKLAVLDKLPDVGKLESDINTLIEALNEGGPKSFERAFNGLSVDQPILKELARKPKYRSLTLSEVLALPEQEWILEDILYDDTVAMVYGPPGSGKSFLIVDWMCHIALARNWFYKPDTYKTAYKRHRVFYVAAEGALGYQRRLRAWMHRYAEMWDVSESSLRSELEKVFHFIPLELPLGDKTELYQFIEDVQEDIERYKNTFHDDLPHIIIIDTLFACAAGLDVNSSAGSTALVGALRTIKRETGASMLLCVHHSGKDIARGMSGNLAFEGSTDISYLITADDSGFTTVLSKKIKDDASVKIYLQRTRVTYGNGHRDNSCVMIPTVAPEQEEGGNKPVSNTQNLILSVLPTDKDKAVSFTEIQKSIAETPERSGKAVPKQTLTDNLNKLVNNLLVVKIESDTRHPKYYRLGGSSDE